jgi:hypothetical protein
MPLLHHMCCPQQAPQAKHLRGPHDRSKSHSPLDADTTSTKAKQPLSHTPNTAGAASSKAACTKVNKDVIAMDGSSSEEEPLLSTRAKKTDAHR